MRPTAGLARVASTWQIIAEPLFWCRGGKRPTDEVVAKKRQELLAELDRAGEALAMLLSFCKRPSLTAAWLRSAAKLAA